ncbi:hypothetical protein B0H10DRAFT_2028031 [Mycena sp. CBHHK59/15]|nr:hypothetical protein B0H10DRAFT_2028031 [Mycena sp. CBHHK59/15]
MSGERRIHRRRSSAGDDDDDNGLVIVTPPADAEPPPLMAAPPPRSRVLSTPAGSRHQRNVSISGLPPNIGQPPPSAGPYRTAYPTSPFRTTFSSHSRTRSFSSPFSPPLPSPLSTSTSFSDQITAPPLPTSHSAPDNVESPKHSRRHSRLHSRNLSVFFPRPGALPQSTIDEDGGQELEVPPTLGANFTFGGRPSNVLPTPPPLTPTSSASRRGHHHKHSMSHTLFSFLEPHEQPPLQLQTQPTPIPVSPWMPISPFVAERKPPPEIDQPPTSAPTPPLAVAVLQFLLGATLWVSGQQSGSLAVTALGYWAVFDAIGVAVPRLHLKASRPYGTARTESVLLFAQSVYLMFSAVYVCKEAVEHLLLSAGEGHHHHAGDELFAVDGIEFPMFLTALAVAALAFTALLWDNHARLVSVANNRIPPLRTLLRSLASPSAASSASFPSVEPTSPTARALSNPYTATPLTLGLALLGTALFAPRSQHRACDLILAAVASVSTFGVAYRAGTVLGTVLLQTAPRRGMAGGRMEGFLRAMRDVERHPQVLHLPAPHLWQLEPGDDKAGGGLVVTLELHVRADLGDDDVLALTRWTWERCLAALGAKGADTKDTEVTVGVVRG